MKLNVRRFVPGDETPKRGILLIRHGPRTSPDIPPLSAMLTKEGIAECVWLGSTIEESPPNVIFSSPVQRCIDTGVRIIEGANWPLEVKLSEMLGHPGPFVIGKINEEVNKLVAFAQENNDWSFLHRHVAGEEVLGMRNRMVGTNNLLNELYPSVDGYVLCISHDSIIAAVTAALGLNPKPWPNPLEGLIIEEM